MDRAKSTSAESKTNEDSTSFSQQLTKSGQKFPTPSPGNGDRVFYESLLKVNVCIISHDENNRERQQRPDSEMAQEWCLAYGILEADKAKELYQLVSRRKLAKGNSPAKVNASRSTENLPAKSKTTKRRKNRDSDDDDDDEDIEFDTGLVDSTVWESKGSSGM